MAIDIDEPVEVATYDPRWPVWYEDDAAEIRRALGDRLRTIEHFGSTAVVGLVAKPIIDVLVAPIGWPLALQDPRALESLGYEYGRRSRCVRPRVFPPEGWARHQSRDRRMKRFVVAREYRGARLLRSRSRDTVRSGKAARLV